MFSLNFVLVDVSIPAHRSLDESDPKHSVYLLYIHISIYSVCIYIST